MSRAMDEGLGHDILIQAMRDDAALKRVVENGPRRTGEDDHLCRFACSALASLAHNYHEKQLQSLEAGKRN